MRLFKRKEEVVATPEIRIVKPGDIILVGGAAYFVHPDHLQQLAVKKIGEN